MSQVIPFFFSFTINNGFGWQVALSVHSHKNISVLSLPSAPHDLYWYWNCYSPDYRYCLFPTLFSPLQEKRGLRDR